MAGRRGLRNHIRPSKLICGIDREGAGDRRRGNNLTEGDVVKWTTAELQLHVCIDLESCSLTSVLFALVAYLTSYDSYMLVCFLVSPD